MELRETNCRPDRATSEFQRWRDSFDLHPRTESFRVHLFGTGHNYHVRSLRLQQGEVGLEVLEQGGRQTDGLGLVVSDRAEFDADLHGISLEAANQSSRCAPRTRVSRGAPQSVRCRLALPCAADIVRLVDTQKRSISMTRRLITSAVLILLLMALGGFGFKKLRRPIFPLDVEMLGITELKSMDEE